MKWRTLVPVLTTAIVSLGLGAGIPEPPLREAAQASGMLIGAAVRPAQLSEAAYASTLAREFNMVEPEDALKWEVVHPEPQTFDFSPADQLVDFATRHGMKVRGHTLVWHRQNPKWLTEGKYNSSELAEILEKHIKTVVGHYRGKIFAWDVVNEASDELHPGQLRSTIWRDQPGIGLAANDPATNYSRELRATKPARSSKLEAGLRLYGTLFPLGARSRSAGLALLQRGGRDGGRECKVGRDLRHGSRFPAARCPHRWRGASNAHLGPPRRRRVHFRQYQTLHGSRSAGPHHRDGCCPAAGCRGQRSPRRSANTSGHLSPDCRRLPVSSGLYGHPDLGFHRQIFMDRIALEEDTGRGSAV